MARKGAVLLIGLSGPVLLCCFLIGGGVSQWIFAFVCASLPVGLFALGAGRNGRLGKTGWWFVVLGAILLVGLTALLGLEGDPLLLLSILLCGVGLAPLLLICVVYPLTFHRYGIRDADLKRLRRFKGDED